MVGAVLLYTAQRFGYYINLVLSLLSSFFFFFLLESFFVVVQIYYELDKFHCWMDLATLPNGSYVDCDIGLSSAEILCV